MPWYRLNIPKYICGIRMQHSNEKHLKLPSLTRTYDASLVSSQSTSSTQSQRVALSVRDLYHHDQNTCALSDVCCRLIGCTYQRSGGLFPLPTLI